MKQTKDIVEESKVPQSKFYTEKLLMDLIVLNIDLCKFQHTRVLGRNVENTF